MTDAFKTVLLTAMENAREGITVSDATLPDNPLIYVNRGFLQMTGYASGEVLYKNCRFLQGDGHAQPAVDKIRRAIARQEPVQVEMLNYRKNGTPFYNRLSVTPVFDGAGRLTNFIGIQEDITALKDSEEASRRLTLEHLVYTTRAQAQQEERELLGKELHDNINQVLATSRLLLTMNTDSFSEQKELMRQSGDLINAAIEEIRQLSRRMVAPRIVHQSLASEVKSLVEKLQPALPFPIRLHINDGGQIFSEDKKLLLYRVIQEGINNCVKYASPTQLDLSLGRRNEGHELLIKDDGVGFDPGLVPEGIGLRNMRSRVEKAAGRFSVQSAPGQGCCLSIWVPLN